MYVTGGTVTRQSDPGAKITAGDYGGACSSLGHRVTLANDTVESNPAGNGGGVCVGGHLPSPLTTNPLTSTATSP